MVIKVDREFEKDCAAVRATVAYKLERSMIDFTERISARLAELDISQAELASRMGVSRAQVTNLLRGTCKNFTFETAHRIAIALDMDFEPLLATRNGIACKCGQIPVSFVEGALKAKTNSTWHSAVLQPTYSKHPENCDYDNAAVANG